jgi:hypothetical protein
LVTAVRDELAFAHVDRGDQPLWVLIQQGLQWRDLLRMGQRIVGHEHPAVAYDPNRMRPPRRVLGAFGVEKEQIDLTSASASGSEAGAAVFEPEFDVTRTSQGR